MPVIREFRCKDCSTTFESMDSDPSCPTCSEETERVFLTAPSIKSPQTQFKDDTVRQLAADYGMSDVSNKYGQAAKRHTHVGPPPEFVGDQGNFGSILGKLQQNNRDSFSGVLPALQQAGNPRMWNKVKDR